MQIWRLCVIKKTIEGLKIVGMNLISLFEGRKNIQACIALLLIFWYNVKMLI